MEDICTILHQDTQTTNSFGYTRNSMCAGINNEADYRRTAQMLKNPYCTDYPFGQRIIKLETIDFEVSLKPTQHRTQ